MMSISGLNSTARPLAVYASQCRLPEHHARLASGRWPGSAGRGSMPRRVPTKGFRVTNASSSPKLSWRTNGLLRIIVVQFVQDLYVLHKFHAAIFGSGLG